MRTSATEVKAITVTALSDPILQQLIAIANRMVTNLLSSSGLAADVLKDIETYLTAHLIAIGPERQTEEERVLDVWVVHQGKFTEGLKSTTFGQMVLVLDTTKSFITASKQKASITAIPQDPDSPTHDV